MPPIEVKDSTELGTLLGKNVDDIDALKGAVEAQQTVIEQKNAEIAEMQQAIESFAEKLKSVQQLVKAEFGAEKENSEEGKLYRIGAMVNSLVKAEIGSQAEQAEAAQVMKRLKAFPSKNVAGARGQETFSLRPGYEELWRAEMHKHWGGFDAKMKAALSSDPLTSDGSDDTGFYGSYLVPTDLVAELQRIAGEASTMMPLVRHIPVRGITTYIPSTTSTLAFTKVTDQETAKTEDTITFGRSTLTVETYAFWLALTEEMDEDSLIGIGQLVRDMGAEAWAEKFDSLALEDATYGAMYATGINTKTMGDGDSAFSNLSVDYLGEMPNELDSRAKRRGARFFMHPTVWDYPENEKDGNGAYILRSPAEGAPARVRGYNVSLTDGMPSSSDSAASTKFVLFGNPNRIVAGDKIAFEFRVFNQTESTMKYDQIFLRCRVRQAMVTTLPSAFVVLQTAA